MALNIEKMKKLKEFVLAEPRRFDQNDWMRVLREDDVEYTWREDAPPCGTVACLAGSACLMEGWVPILDDNSFNGFTNFVTKENSEARSIKSLGASILGLEPDDIYDISYNFFRGDGSGWSRENHHAYNQARNATERAQAAANEIDRLIQKELDRLASLAVE